jgi:hypothetical protein
MRDAAVGSSSACGALPCVGYSSAREDDTSSGDCRIDSVDCPLDLMLIQCGD